jgi:transposase
METRRRRTRRAEWQKRIERWNDSGLSAEEFAAELGVKAGTLRYWKYSLAKEARGRGRTPARPATPPPEQGSFIEVRPSVALATGSFELELSGARRLRIPPQFDAAALERLLTLLGDR